MPDREKVIRWLEACSTGCEYGCPYEYEGTVVLYECKADLMRDALELLKAQESVEPHKVPRSIAYPKGAFVCPDCLRFLEPDDPFCPGCGRAVKWDD